MEARKASRVAASAIPREDLTRLRMTLGRLGRILRQQTDDNLSYALTSLLFAIGRSEPATASDLAESENVTPPSVSRSLNRLESMGFIERTADPTDGRVSLIRLTAEGRRERELILRSRDVWLIEHLERLSPDEVADLMSALPALERMCDPELSPPA